MSSIKVFFLFDTVLIRIIFGSLICIVRRYTLLSQTNKKKKKQKTIKYKNVFERRATTV